MLSYCHCQIWLVLYCGFCAHMVLNRFLVLFCCEQLSQVIHCGIKYSIRGHMLVFAAKHQNIQRVLLSHSRQPKLISCCKALKGCMASLCFMWIVFYCTYVCTYIHKYIFIYLTVCDNTFSCSTTINFTLVSFSFVSALLISSIDLNWIRWQCQIAWHTAWLFQQRAPQYIEASVK